jgi:hypothetical protein
MQAGVRYRVNTPSIVSEVLDGEGVMINLDTGTYYSASGVGGAIWSLLEAGAHAEEIAGWLEATWGRRPELRADLHAYIARVLAEQLVVAAPERAAPVLPPVRARTDYVQPTLEVFQDMQDLLLADPIHDVDQAGWPPRPDAPSR